MAHREPSRLLGRAGRRASPWLGVVAAAVAGSFVLLRTVEAFGRFQSVLLAATAVAAVLALVQAYRNGSATLSVLLATAPVWGSLAVGTGQAPLDGQRYAGLLVATLFAGTAAHLVGVEAAESRGASPRSATRAERLGLLATLCAAGAVFVTWYVAPLWT